MSALPAREAPASILTAQAVLGDKILLMAIGLSAVAAIGMGLSMIDATLAIGMSLALLALAVAVYVVAKGTLMSSLVLALVLVGMVVLHIQIARGMVELHFGVFVTLALLMVYLDWRPIVWAAAAFALHHVAFDRLLAAGFGFYCLNEPDFSRIVVHAVYVVIQTVLQVILVVRMRQSALAGDELNRMVLAMDQGSHVALRVDHLAVTTPIAIHLQRTLQRMRQVVTSVQAAGEHVTGVSREIASGNADLSARTEQAAQRLEGTATHMRQLTQAVAQSAESARAASTMAQTNAEVAVRGGEVVGQVVSTMQDINQSSQKIADIIGVIDSIAFQTNILALNAAVEAARAGEQGRGFAVVASEVRSLAQRSAGAAKEIKELIGASVGRVEVGSRLVQEAGVTIGEMVGHAERINAVIGEIRQAGAEQAQGLSQVSQAVDELDRMTQQNAALVEESTAAAESLSVEVDRLNHAVAVFKA
ncbi:MAG: methyl-accepting chemotaxis protein [Burkholderiaceae bacterium]|jgi:methyl-accepting chemotaxis protein|nr:methyl-accepting chemotaxis protein [Burkholderiaceae bacterium]